MAAEKIYGKLLANLLPPGPAWSTEPKSNLSKLLSGMAEELERVDDQSGGLVLEANPLTMSTLLDIRYTEAGLPDLCKGKPALDSEQQKEVIAKWSARGGQSIAYFNEVAENYGYDVLIEEYAIFKIEQTAIETLGIDSEYAFAWKVNYVDEGALYFRSGAAKADDRLEDFKGIGINCVFDKLKPAHTSITYQAWDTAMDLFYKPVLSLNFQEMAEMLPSSITFTRGSTATRVNSLGFIEEVIGIDEARFDYHPVELYCKGLLCEASSRNYSVYNRDLSNAAWTKSAASVAASAIMSPDGINTAQKVVENSATAEHYVSTCNLLTTTTNVYMAFSVFLKSGERTSVRLHVINGDLYSGFYADFDLVNGVVLGNGVDGYGTFSNAYIEEFPGGWYRCTVAGKPDVTDAGTLNSCRISMLNGAVSYAGNGVSGLYAWGSQLEIKEFSTSLIYTDTTDEIRFFDWARMAGAAMWWLNESAGTIAMTGFINYQKADGYDPELIHVETDGTNDNSITIKHDSVAVINNINTSAVLQASINSGPLAFNVPFRTDLAYQPNDCAASTLGAACGTDASVTVPGVTSGKSCRLGWRLNGCITQFTYYAERIENAHLQEISSLG
jgi:uncharacterized protein YmfQ (DUF2313 family)